MPFDLEDNTFLLAGPVKMHPRVLRAMSVPAMEHRAPLFVEKNRAIRDDLKHVFQTERSDVVLMSGSGTLGMDAAAQSLLAKGDKAVAIGNGKFGNRFCDLAARYGDAKVLKAGMGEPIDLAEIEKAVAETSPKAVFLTHNESSAGFTWPLKDIAKIAHDHGALVVADCITSVGALDVPVDEWGIDVAIVGSQKALGAPAGLVALAVSPDAQGRMHDHGYYLNLPKWIKKFRDGDTPFTPAIPLHLAMAEALKIVREEGLENRIARVRAQAQAVRAAVEAMGLQFWVEDPQYRSDSVTAIRYPDGVDDKKFRSTLKDRYGIVVAGGQDEAKGKIFRIGTLGTVSWPEVAGAFAGIEKTLVDLGAPVKKGAWCEAFAGHMA